MIAPAKEPCCCRSWSMFDVDVRYRNFADILQAMRRLMQPTHAPTHAYANGGGKVDHVGGLIVDSPSGTFCRRP